MAHEAVWHLVNGKLELHYTFDPALTETEFLDIQVDAISQSVSAIPFELPRAADPPIPQGDVKVFTFSVPDNAFVPSRVVPDDALLEVVAQARTENLDAFADWIVDHFNLTEP